LRAPGQASAACCTNSLATKTLLAPPPRSRMSETRVLPWSLRPPRRRPVDVSARLVSPWCKAHERKSKSMTDRDTDAAEADNAEDGSPTKKKASPTKRKGKAVADTAGQEEETVVKSEAGD
jgi:hypothetical protein